MHFVHEQQAPLSAADLVHHTRALLAALTAEGNHGVGGDGHPTHPCQPLLLIRCEPEHARAASSTPVNMHAGDVASAYLRHHPSLNFNTVAD